MKSQSNNETTNPSNSSPGLELLRTGRYDEAFRVTQHCLSADPGNADDLHALGVLYAFRRDWAQAEQALRRALAGKPESANWWRDLGIALLGSGRPSEAIQPFAKSIELAPTCEVLSYYAHALELTGERAEAVRAYHQSIRLDPKAVRSFERLVILYQELRYYDRSHWYAARAAKLNRFDAQSLYMLAHCQFQVGNLQTALRTHRRAFKDSNEKHHSAYLAALVHDLKQSAQSLRNAHENWFRLHGGESGTRTTFQNVRDPEKKLRLGYVSGEFRCTPGHHFILPLLKGYNRDRFEIYCYSLTDREDATTAQYRRAASKWCQVPASNAEWLKKQVLADRIDILVDISGHLGLHALAAFHRRSAPVQVTYMNYPCTTGCKEVDFFLTDSWTTPYDESSVQQYSEANVYRVPGGCLLYQPTDSPEVSPLPALTNGYVTFGLFQRPAKFNDEFWDAVAAILQQTRTARLLVHHANRDLEEPVSITRSRIQRSLMLRGVDPSRVDFAGLKSALDHLAVVARVDIALDTFPYNGHTTTCGSLWMGVPVVTIAGSRHASRVSYSLLARLGLSDWAGASVEEYVRIATSKASNLEALRSLRASLRQTMSGSSVCRPDLVVPEIEAGFRWMWKQWCASSELAKA